MVEKIGRNDPCPCGSGRKYKKCCLNTAPDPVNYMKEKLDRFHERIIDRLFRHAAEVYGEESFGEAAAEFFGWPEEEEEFAEISLEEHASLFYPWFLFKWRLDEDDDESGLDCPRELSVTESFLQRHGRKLDALEREYLEACVKAEFSFFQALALEPGTSVTLRDLLLDRDLQVLDKSMSRCLHKGDVVFGFVIEAGGIALMGATSAVSLPPSVKARIFDLQDQMMRASDGDRITSEVLYDYDLELRMLYLGLFAAHTRPPELRNTSGEKLSFHTLKYSITSPQKAFDALKSLTGDFATEEELLAGAEYDDTGGLLRVEIPWLVAGNPQYAGMDNTLLGRVMIDNREMTAEVNSAERAARLRKIIEKRLSPDDFTYRATRVQSGESMMAEASSSPPPGPDLDQDLMNNPELRAHIDEMMRKHWEEWLDLDLPALDGRTPRQAVRDRVGRRQVEALLEDAERRCRAADGAMGRIDDLVWVRKELGL